MPETDLPEPTLGPESPEPGPVSVGQIQFKGRALTLQKTSVTALNGGLACLFALFPGLCPSPKPMPIPVTVAGTGVK